MTPTCVAARPMPSASCMTWPMRRISSRSASSKRSIGSARLRSTGSPYLRTSVSAASRRARVSGSSRRGGILLGDLGRLVGHRADSIRARAPRRGSRRARSLRVHVDGEAHVAVLARVRRAVDGGPHGGDRRGAVVRLDHDLGAIAAAQPEQRRRAEHGRARRARRGAARSRRPPRAARPASAPSRRPGSGRRTAGSAAPAAARARRVTNPRVSWRAAAAIAGASGAVVWTSTRPPARPAAGAAGELRDQRERPLLGAEVGEAQGRVGVDHHAERDVGEVVALGDHLRADEQARPAPPRSARAAPGPRPWRPRCRRRAGTRGRRAPRPARPRAARSPRRGGRRTASRTRRSAPGPARGARSGGRRPRASARCSTSATSHCGHSQTFPQSGT